MMSMPSLPGTLHQRCPCLLIEDSGFFRLVVGTPTEGQTLFKGLLSRFPVTCLRRYRTQDAVNRVTIVHKAAQIANTLDVGSGSLIGSQVDIAFCKEWNVEIASVTSRLRACSCTVKLCTRCRSPTRDCEEVAIERHCAGVPLCIVSGLDAGLEKLLCLAPISSAEI